MSASRTEKSLGKGVLIAGANRLPPEKENFPRGGGQLRKKVMRTQAVQRLFGQQPSPDDSPPIECS